MDGKTYINEAMRTASNQFHGELVNPVDFVSIMQRCANRLDTLDKYKKALFYGKKLPDDVFQMAPTTEKFSNLIPLIHSDQGEMIVHGAIGIATEAGELLESLVKTMVGSQGLDRANVKEELGDVFWYIAILCKALGFTFEDIMETNIEKLRMRFPEKFTEELAINRNVDKERELLEAKTQ